MTYEIMQILWYIIVGLAIVFYVVLDGFDLGVGSLQIFAGSDKNKRIFLNSIGPFWDGNEVWLVIIAGGLFVGFPDVYAALFSGFYALFMFMLLGVIIRTCAIEFRSKMQGIFWRLSWDTLFWLSSLMITFGAGILLGNLLKGVPLNANRELYLSFKALFTPYPVLVGIMAIFLFMMHGNHFLLMKTEGDLQRRLHRWVPWTTGLFTLLFIIVTVVTWGSFPYMVEPFFKYPVFFLVPFVLFCFLIAMNFASYRKMHGVAFTCSMITISLLFLLYAIGTFPNLVISSISPELNNLTLYNSSASEITLGVALVIAAIGVPLVLAYGWILYYVFRGKTKVHEHSY